MADLKLYNTLTRTKQVFVPEDEKNVRMYVCGPTVYDFAHIGNARPVIVFDVLYRLLRHLYGEEHVTYVRNITDVDDKINARAKRDYPDLPLNEAIRNVTEKTAAQFHADVKALGCLPPTHEPRATEHIDGMISIIQTLLEKDHAYVADGTRGREVLFDISKMDGKNNIPKYGLLSNRNLDEQKSGARVEVELHKRNAGDFVLWKQSKDDEPGWSGEFNGETIHGRPGWHIECSAMSEAFLGKTFDIHGGGLDLIFPHHENEIAQSCCAHGTDKMANVWMHNGYVQVEGKKMSKSDGNFVTIHDLLHTEKFGGRSWPAPVLRYAMLMKDYREPIDFTEQSLLESYADIAEYSSMLDEIHFRQGFDFDDALYDQEFWKRKPEPSEVVVLALSNDLDTRAALIEIKRAYNSSEKSYEDMKQTANDLRFLGLIEKRYYRCLTGSVSSMQWGEAPVVAIEKVMPLARRLKVAFVNNDLVLCNELLNEISSLGFTQSEFRPGSFDLSYVGSKDSRIQNSITSRLQFLKDKNFAEADRIRDELLEQGIQLKDGKDPETGERVTTWEVKR